MKLSPLYRNVLVIAAPAVVELVLTSATALADTIMVGQLGAYAISAVGLTNQPRLIMLATLVALNVGTTALVARFRVHVSPGSLGLVRLLFFCFERHVSPPSRELACPPVWCGFRRLVGCFRGIREQPSPAWLPERTV